MFGVDLIYLNATLGNLVMLQCKMLEPTGHGEDKDWIYRPDESLDKEMKRMKQFSADIISTARQYRFNTSVFYMKFIKREATHRGGGIILPLEHFEQILASPQAEGPRKGIRISYDLLNGRYLRQAAFIDLVRSGYVGSHSATTEHFKVLIDAVLTQGNAAVAAIQHLTEPDYT